MVTPGALVGGAIYFSQRTALNQIKDIEAGRYILEWTMRLSKLTGTWDFRAFRRDALCGP
jgi:hypothetical protein